MAQTKRRKSKAIEKQTDPKTEIPEDMEISDNNRAGEDNGSTEVGDILDPDTLWPSEANAAQADADELEKVFATLTEITDRVSLMNSVYDSDLDGAFSDLDRFTAEIAEWNYDDIPEDSRSYFLSHLTFHREIIADIIQEARSLLYEERRPFLKKLVKYHREYAAWLSKIERKYS